MSEPALNLCFVNRYYDPDRSATSRLLTDLATALAKEGRVRVLASRDLYDGSRSGLPGRERRNGVEIVRLRTTRLGRAAFWRRLVDGLAFSLHVTWFLLRRTRPGNVVVLMTDPPFLPLLNTAAVRLRGGRVINWIQDLYPETAFAIGAVPRGSPAAKLLFRWRNRALRAAAAGVVIGQAMERHLSGLGVHGLHRIPNWVDGSAIAPLEHEDNPLRRDWGLGDRFVVGYSGNFGRAHAFDEILAAARRLQPDERVQFVFIGDGAALPTLAAAVRREGLSNVSFRPWQPPERLRCSLGALDLHLVTLKPGLEGYVLPSKLYGALAAGRPVAFVGDGDGEIAALVRAHDVGFAVGHGAGGELAEQIARLAGDPDRCRRLGDNARRLFEREHDRPRALERWRRLLREVGGLAASRPPG